MSVSATRKAKIEITSSAAGVDKGLDDARRKMRTFAREQAKASREAEKAEKKRAKEAEKARANAGKLTIGVGQSITAGLAAAAGFDTAGGLAGIAHDIMDTQRELTRFQIDAQLSTSAVNAFNDSLTETSNRTGISRNSLVHAAHAYQILTGDAQGAIKASSLFADVANASGASMEDIAGVAASLKQNLAFDPSDFRKGFDVLLTLGHKGSIELRDVAGEMSGLAPQFKEFGRGDALGKLTEMGAAMEVVKFNFANAAETATGFRAAMTAISKTKVADRLANAGVKVWEIDPKTKKHIKRDFFDIMADIKKKIPDQKILADILGGRQESFRAITAMIEHYDEMVKLKKEAENSDQVAKDSATYLESSSGRIAKVWEQIKNSIADALSPDRVQAFATLLEKAGDAWAGIYNVGRKIRGAISGDKARTLDTQASAIVNLEKNVGGDRAKMRKEMRAGTRSGLTSDIYGKLNDAELDNLIDAAKRRASGVSAANATAESIMGAESDEKSTPESIRKAVFATFGKAEVAEIGRQYLGATGVSDDERDRIAAKALKDATKPMVDLLKDIADSVGTPAPVKVGAEPIQKAASNNMLHRTRPGGR